MTKDEALKLALEAFKEINYDQAYANEITAIREALALSESSTKCEETSHAQPEHPHNGVFFGDERPTFSAGSYPLAQPEQETVAYQDIAEKCRLETVPAKGTLLHTSPPASKSWQGLTGEGIDKLADMHRKE